MNVNRVISLALFSFICACSSGAGSSVPAPLQNLRLSPAVAVDSQIDSKTNQYRYGGCGVFPPGDIFNHASRGYLHDPNTAEMFVKAPQGNFAYWDDQGDEQVNLSTSKSATWYTAEGVSGGHNPPLENSTTWPWTNGMFIEQGDAHAIILLTDTCQEYEAYGAQWTAANGPFALYGGRTNNLMETWMSQLIDGESAVTQAGIPLLPSTYWGEDADGQRINHIGSILLVAGYCLSQYGWVYPATSPGYVVDTQKCTHPIHMGDLFKLRDSFNCQLYTAVVATLCRSMKRFPLVVDDELSPDSNEPWAIRFGLTASGEKAWPYSGSGGLEEFLTALTPSANVWVHVEPPGYAIQCLAGHTYGFDCW
jgi:hypothetical protein